MVFLTLNNGQLIPQLGLGCGGIYNKRDLHSKKNRMLYSVYKKAVKTDYVLYDSEGTGYHQLLLGRVSGKKKNRENMYLVTKLSNREQREGNVRKAFENSLRALKTDYLDLYLMHWPQTDTFVDCYLQMEELYRSGAVKAIGVCNFHEHHIEQLMQKATIVPMVNQFEIHPLFTQKPLIAYCRRNGIQPMAYTPLGRMHDVLIRSGALRDISEKYQKSVPEIIIRWDIQQGLCVIPMTTKFERFQKYLDLFNFQLTEEEMERIDEINDNVRLRYNPDKCDFRHL